MNRNGIIQELTFTYSRSSGAGGQHVNKVSSRVSVLFDIRNSTSLSEREKHSIAQKLASRITKNHILLLHCEESRSQHRNKELVIRRLITLLENALLRPKVRKRTKPTRRSIANRLQNKKHKALKKENRKKPDS